MTNYEIGTKAETLNGGYKFSCAFCNHRSDDKVRLYEHINLHKDDESFRCLECEFMTKEALQLMLHLQSGCISYKCTSCTYKCNDKIKFIDHMELHVPEFKCAYCDHLTKSERALLVHFTKEHVALDELSCSSCEFITSIVQDFINHLRRHDDDLPFKCLLCDYSTHCKDTLIDHLETHGFDLLKCDKCYIKCSCDSIPTRLNVSSSASKKRPYKCKVCLYTFTRKQNLSRHMKLHGQQEEFDRDNMLYCAICGFGTFVKITLINHLKIHRVK